MLSKLHSMQARHILVLAVILLLTACSQSSSDYQSESAPSAFTPADIEQHHAVITERVIERWNALKARDFEKVYSFAQPSYRSVAPLMDIVANYDGPLPRGSIAVDSVELDESDKTLARVMVRVTVFMTMNSGGAVTELESPLVQKWIYRNGEWWHVEKLKRTGMSKS